MSPPQSRPRQIGTEFDVTDAELRRTEMIVLGQIRDNMALMQQDLRAHGQKLDGVNDNVVSLLSARYDEQIADTRRQVDREIDMVKRQIEMHERDNKQAFQDQEVRIRDHDRLIARLGLGMTIAASIGSMALGAVIVQFISQVMK